MNIMRVSYRCAIVAVALGVCFVQTAAAQTVSQRGFVEGSDTVFAHVVPNDQARQVVDALYREEIFVKPKPWLQFAGGLDFRANTHSQIDTRWRLDLDDRTILRPAAAMRRLAVTVSTKYVTVDVGKQFIRW
ncbi:MAG TPA: hypothetical protein VFP91_11545, partial [Vicinamibacterales bacterium]|nr:hypothetical protein [Vicinamibacterales bacterium]